MGGGVLDRSIYRRRPGVAAWLFLESAINVYFAVHVIPEFYYDLPFTMQVEINGTCLEGLRHDNNDDDKEKKRLPKLENEVQFLNSPKCQSLSPEILAEATDELFWSISDACKKDPTCVPNYNNVLLGGVLLVCGFLAPLGEMVGRLIYNVFRLALVEEICPKVFRFYDVIYESLHSSLQHLTQFKLFLCYLELSLQVDPFGVNVYKMMGGLGVRHFVLFAIWSIFITSIVSKIEKDGGSVNLLPPKAWLPKQIGTYHGHYPGTVTIKNTIIVLCFHFFMSRSPFTILMDYHGEASNNTQLPPTVAMLATNGTIDVMFYEDGFGPFNEGFNTMFNENFGSMGYLLYFQIVICNLSLPIVQLLHTLLQECLAHRCGISVGWHSSQGQDSPREIQAKANDVDNDVETEEDDEIAADDVRSLVAEEAEGDESDEIDGDTPTLRTWSGPSDIIEVFCFLCVENQAHEFFLLGVAMLLNVIECLLQSLQTETVKAYVCYNPLAATCMFCGVALLGLPRQKLHMALEGDGRRAKPFYRQETGCLSRNDLATQFWFVARTSIMVLVLSYFLVLKTGVQVYGGVWTVNQDYVNGTFLCSVTDGISSNCVKGDLLTDDNLHKIQQTLMVSKGIHQAPLAKFNSDFGF